MTGTSWPEPNPDQNTQISLKALVIGVDAAGVTHPSLTRVSYSSVLLSDSSSFPNCDKEKQEQTLSV